MTRESLQRYSIDYVVRHRHVFDPKTIPVVASDTRIDLGRGPLTLDCSVWRYGTEQRLLKPSGDDPVGWHGGWPAYTELEDAWDSYCYFMLGESCRRKYEFRVVAYPPEPLPFAYRMERG